MRQGKVHFIINVPTISGGAVRDGNMMRRLAVEMNIPFVTTISGAKMEVEAMRAMKNNDLEPVSLNVKITEIEISVDLNFIQTVIS